MPSQRGLKFPCAVLEGSSSSSCILEGCAFFFPGHPRGVCIFLASYPRNLCSQAILMVTACWTLHQNTWVMPRYGWLTGDRNNLLDAEGPKLCLAWSQQGHPLTSLAGSWIMPGGSMGTCVMLLHPTLTILVVSCITPFHHSIDDLNHFLILSLGICGIHTVTQCLPCHPYVDLHCTSCYCSQDMGIIPRALLVGIWAYLV